LPTERTLKSIQKTTQSGFELIVSRTLLALGLHG
jgi:hypothetical protein